jgi:hypothetical protein
MQNHHFAERLRAALRLDHLRAGRTRQALPKAAVTAAVDRGQAFADRLRAAL